MWTISSHKCEWFPPTNVNDFLPTNVNKIPPQMWMISKPCNLLQSNHQGLTIILLSTDESVTEKTFCFVINVLEALLQYYHTIFTLFVIITKGTWRISWYWDLRLPLHTGCLALRHLDGELGPLNGPLWLFWPQKSSFWLLKVLFGPRRSLVGPKGSDFVPTAAVF